MNEDEAKWEKAVQWCISEFGFRHCLIFRLDILAVDEDAVEMVPLQCYVKNSNTASVLARCKEPTKVHHADAPSLLLPDTQHVSWIWHTKKSHAIGMEPLHWPLEQVETRKEISTLFIKKRAILLLGIEDAMQAELWRQSVYQEHRDNHGRRQAELADMER